MVLKIKKAERIHNTLTYRVEKKIIDWILRRLPDFVTPDSLTILGLLAGIGVGLSYYMSQFNSFYLILCNFFLLMNWFGDSLDGGLARFRKKTRERYGYYLDHITDTFVLLFVLLGVSFSGLIPTSTGLFLLILYYIASINTYLTAYSRGKFYLSYERIGPTEIRILAFVLNLLIFYDKNFTINLKLFRSDLFELFYLVLIIAYFTTLLKSVFSNIRYLHEKGK